MASRLAGEIYNEFEIMPELIEGHNGIFKVAIDGRVVYTNQSQCGHFPSTEEILRKIEAYGGTRPGSTRHSSRGVTGELAGSGRGTCAPGATCSCDTAVTGQACCPAARDPGGVVALAPARSLVIDFLYLDLSECGRCMGSDAGLDEAVAEVRPVLSSLGIDITVNKIHVQTEEQARELRFASSPTIRINGVDIAEDIRESPCTECGTLCGDRVTCREWLYKGMAYPVPPKPLILDAILHSLYAESPKSPEPFEDVPENLKRFFRGRQSGKTM